MKHQTMKALTLLLALVLLAAACGSDSDESSSTAAETGSESSEPADDSGDDAGSQASADAVTIEYWLWDGNQQPVYQECADDFTAANPNIDINITQFGWADYWDGVTTGFASGSGPDVFTDHLARYPEFVASGVLTPLNDLVERDNVDTTQYFPGLAELWVDAEGNRYGLPKDFDTIALVTNSDMLTEAGMSVDDLSNLEWNPTDGGSFGEMIIQLTIDENGVRGNEDGFDPENVAVHGLGLEGAFGAFGQTTFSSLAASTGFEMLDVNPFGDSANYDDPNLAATIQWYADWIDAGYIVAIEDVESLGGTTIFQNGSAAMMMDGSWKIGTYIGPENPFPVEFAPVPVGPSGQRASMFNGLADSINAASEHQEEAWQWVKYLGSSDCQDVMGAAAVVFPAIPSAADAAIAAREAAGVDVSAFTTHVDDGTTFLFAITDSAGQIEAIVGPAMQEILRGQATAAERLAQIDQEVDALLGS